MASFLIPNSATLTPTLPFLSTSFSRATLRPLHVPKSPTLRFTAGICLKTGRGLTTLTRAGPSTSSYVFAFVFPLSLLAITIFTSIRIADKLDRDFLEELAINQAIREADEKGGENGVDVSLEDEVQEPVLPRARTRNRPKREA